MLHGNETRISSGCWGPLARVCHYLYLLPWSARVTKVCFYVCVPQEGDSEIAAKMQDLALAEGALPRHLHTAMFTQSTDNRLLTNRYVS